MPAAKSIPEAAERWALPARQERSREMRGRILAAAETVFAKKGYEGARMSDIAAAAKCSVGAVYFRFKDKDALFFAIAESFAEDARSNLSGLLAGDNRMTAEEAVRNFVLCSAALFRQHKGMFRAIMERGFEHRHAMHTVMGLRDEMEAALVGHLRRNLSPKRQGDLTLAVRVVTQMIYGFLITGVLNARAPTKITDPRAVDEAAAAVTAYLSTKGFLT